MPGRSNLLETQKCAKKPAWSAVSMHVGPARASKLVASILNPLQQCQTPHVTIVWPCNVKAASNNEH